MVTHAGFPISQRLTMPIVIVLVGVLAMCGKQPYGAGAPGVTPADTSVLISSDTPGSQGKMDAVSKDTNLKDVPLGVPVQPESYRDLKEKAKQLDRDQEKKQHDN